MAKDDYHVILYQILSYLYTCLKKDVPVDGKKLLPGSDMLKINENYWRFIIVNAYKSGLISGLIVTKAAGGIVIIDGLNDTMITPAGIEYLCDNSFIAKAKEFVEDTVGIISPFIGL